MKISALNYGVSPICYRYFKGNLKNNMQKRTMGVENQLPNPALYADCSSFSLPFSKVEALKKDYTQKIMHICFDSNKKLDKRLSDFLDSQTFEIETSTPGVKKQMTIKDAVRESVVRTGKLDMTLFHATGYKEIGDQIIKEGFDPFKISRAQFGPGFYFSPSEGGAREYSGCVLKADCKGNCATFSDPFYDRIARSNVTNEIAKFIGLDSKDWTLKELEHGVCSRVLNEYTRDFLVNDLGYDMGFGFTRFDSCFAIYNPAAISNIRF